jgi:hypothetical protein
VGVGERTKVMKISRQPSSALIMIDQKMEQVEHFNHLGSMITNGAGCALEIACRTAAVQAAFNKKFF